MWDKLKNDKYAKALLTKLITILVVASIALLLFDVLTQSKDGRRQIVDENGGTEYQDETQASAITREENRLKEILGDIKGVGEVDVMITYQTNASSSNLFNGEEENRSKVEGVIVTASGAGDIVIKNSITNAVKAVFDIPASNVSVFEKSNTSQ